MSTVKINKSKFTSLKILKLITGIALIMGIGTLVCPLVVATWPFFGNNLHSLFISLSSGLYSSFILTHG